MGEQTPEVRFEPCAVWEAGADPASGTCLLCGWLEEDHWLAELNAAPRPGGHRRHLTATRAFLAT